MVYIKIDYFKWVNIVSKFYYLLSQLLNNCKYLYKHIIIFFISLKECTQIINKLVHTASVRKEKNTFCK